MPRGVWPSTNRTLLRGSELGNLIFSKASSVFGGSEQKKLSVRSLQNRQLSTSSIPYGAWLMDEVLPGVIVAILWTVKSSVLPAFAISLHLTSKGYAGL